MLGAMRRVAILLLAAAVTLPGGHAGPSGGHAGPSGGHAGPPLPPKEPPKAPVNVNTATVVELQTVPGVGPSTARDIVRYREKNGPFRRVEELLIIRGMSKKKLARMRPYVRVR